MTEVATLETDKKTSKIGGLFIASCLGCLGLECIFLKHINKNALEPIDNSYFLYKVLNMVNKKTKIKQQQKVMAKFNLSPLSAGVRLAITGMLASTLTQPVYAELPVAGQNFVSVGRVDAPVITGNKMQINQRTDKAALNWKSFDIGAGNHVNFSQPNSTSVALNRIGGNKASDILGKLTANGQIYLINKNGFIFGSKSVINVNSLIASTHNISDDVFERGITRVFDETKEAAFALDTELIEANQAELKKILVKHGAKITADDSGRIIMVAPEIENRGELEVGKQGQIMLVASQDKVYLQQADSKEFAGLLVEVDTGGKVSNFGSMLAKQGNITMAGFVVNQAGRVNATTSVNVNGAIRLQAREGHAVVNEKLVGKSTMRATAVGNEPRTEATLSFADGSLTAITPEDSKASAIDEQTQPDSFLEFSAHDIEFKSGSKVVAPGANLKITATDSPNNPLLGNSGRITMEKGSVIDVSGIRGVNVSMERNVVEVDVKSFELRDSPFQRNSVLNGQKVDVDIRKDTAIVDTSGARSRIKRTAFERMTEGGNIEMTASGKVDVQKGAVIDISGGSVDVASGKIKTTYLQNEVGKIVEISDANPDEKYVNLFKQEYSEVGYTIAKDAGILEIKTPDILWNGELNAAVINRRRQRTKKTRAKGGDFSVDMSVFNSTKGIDILNGDAFARLDRSGLQKFTLKTWGKVSVADNVSLAFEPWTNVVIEAGNINVYGDIYTAGGKINLSAKRNVTLNGELVLGSDAVLDVSGRWINDPLTMRQGITPTEAIVIGGGSVALSAEGDLTAEQGAKILANGGARLIKDDKYVAGKGGDIALKALGNGTSASLLFLGAQLSASGLESNGKLTLASSGFAISNRNLTDIDSKTTFIDANNAIFSDFSSVTLNAEFESIVIESNAAINLAQRNRRFHHDFISTASHRSLDSITAAVILPEPLRETASQLSLFAKREITMAYGSSILSEAGSTISFVAENSIFADGRISAPAGKIAMKIKAAEGGAFDSKQALWLGEHAELLAKGTVKLDANPRFKTGDVLAGGEIDLIADRGYIIIEEKAVLDVSGTSTVLDLAINGSPSFGYQSAVIGSDAGAIKLVAAEGMLLEGEMTGIGGTDINRDASLLIELNRNKRNEPTNVVVNPPFPHMPLTMTVTQNLSSDFSSSYVFGDELDPLLTGHAGLSADNLMRGGFDYIELITPDSIQFKGDVNLAAGIGLKIDASSIGWQAENGQTDGTVNLDAAYLSIGSSLNRQVNGEPIAGDATFNANGQWVSLFGAIKAEGFGLVNISSRNDLQLKGIQLGARDYLGEWVTAANLNLSASKIYPASLTEYRIAVENNPEGAINISGTEGNSAIPLTAAGKLTLQAAHIRQAGTVLAPLGEINLQAAKTLVLADGSVTSVSAKGLLIPLGVVQGGLDWLYPLNSVENLIFDAAQEKKVVLKAPAIDLVSGSVIDLSGGGDIFSYEFQKGAGGSFDYLLTGSGSNQNSFAVMPALGTEFAPFDFFQSAGSPYKNGETVYLNAGNGLKAGEYARLPAHYALLPGAFLVTAMSDTQDQTLNARTIDGRTVVSGYSTVAGTGKRDARSSGFMIENGEQVRKHSKYETFTGNKFFADKAKENETVLPVLAKDSGIISIQAQTKLRLNGLFNIDAAAHGKGAGMDISATNIRVANTLSEQQEEGVLEILASDLSNLNIVSLLLGGERQRGDKSGETVINVGAESVTFQQNSELDVNDLIVTANNGIFVNKGAKVSATGNIDTSDRLLTVNGDGALLRVSGSAQVDLNRKSSAGLQGQLIVAEGSILQADKSMLLDSSQSTEIAGEIVMNGGSLNLAANAINIGEVDGLENSSALNLSNASLNRMSVDELVLTSRDSVNFYGNTGKLDATGVFQAATGGLAAVEISKLVINAAGISGFATQHGASADNSVNLKLNEFEFKNTLGSVASLPATGSAKLNVEAESITAGEGTFTVSGFESVNLTANEQFKTDGEGRLLVDAALNVAAPLVTASSKSDYKIDAAGHQAVFSGTGNHSEKIVNELTGKLAITADQVAVNTHFSLASGQLGLTALTGDVTLAGQAAIDLSGRQFVFADLTKVTSGGALNVIADHGSIRFQQGSSVNLNGGDNQQLGGTLNLKAIEGDVELNGRMTAQAGTAIIDVAGFEQAEDFSGLINKLNDAGISRKFNYRSRERGINLAADAQIKAQQVKLTADKSSIIVAGKIIADDEKNSKIELFAADNIVLESGSELSANTLSSEQGGKVLLSATDSDLDNLSGIDIQAGSFIKVGNANGKHGKVVLRALRSDSDADGIDDSINIKQVLGTVTGYQGRTVSKEVDGVVTHYNEGNQFYAEGVKIYQDSDGEINSADIAEYKADADIFMAEGNRLKVGADLHSDLQLRPGIEVQSDGDLTLNSDLDTVDWRYASLIDTEQEKYDAAVGQVTLRAAKDLILNSSISDGFKEGIIGFTTIVDQLQAGNSWSFNLVAGADIDSADMTAVDDLGSLVIGSEVKVRTGSGDIKVAVAEDVTFVSQTSVLYNAGRPDTISPYGNWSDFALEYAVYSEYPISGGDIDIVAGGNINGVASTQFINSWLLRQGNWSNTEDHAAEIATSWGIGLGYMPAGFNAATSNKPLFEQNIGSFGGGRVSIAAKGDITDLAVMMPTTGKQVGTPDPNATFQEFLSNKVEINGGGIMRVAAGGDIAGGVFLLGRGQGELNAGGSIKGGTQFTEGPLLALGDSQFVINAGGDIDLSAVTDPMILHNKDSNFFSYSERSSLDISSAAGNVFLGADSKVIGDILKNNGLPGIASGGAHAQLLKIYPASLNVTAFGGSILLKNQIILFPSALGNLNILAKNNISSASSQLFVGMSDTERRLLPTAIFPVASNAMKDARSRLNPIVRGALAHASTPLHAEDSEPVRFITVEGDISQLNITAPKRVIVKAGNDLGNMQLIIQHVNEGDVSVIEAGRDLKFSSERNLELGTLEASIDKIEVAGPGDVLIKTGRHIDLGASEGIVTLGNASNSALADSGANLTIMAGIAKEPDYLGFVNQMKQFVLDHEGDEIISKKFFSDLADLDVNALGKMDSVSLNIKLMPLFYSALKTGGTAEAKGNVLGNKLGFDAISALFPGSGWKGDLKLFFSKIQTIAGGDINLAVPGGDINAGLAVSFSGAKPSSELGIVAQREGEINAFLSDTFLVNQSRVFALGGDDILVWSSEGDIDAGRGAKSAIAAPPPIIRFDEDGNLVIEFPPIVSGSGIRTAASAGKQAGDVFLFAPQGTINAGEAGIGGNNVVLVAKAVLGADNIDVGGTSVGVPTQSSAAPPVSVASNSTASVSKSAEKTVRNGSAEQEEKKMALGLLSVDVVGFGSGDEDECGIGGEQDDKDCNG